MEIEDSNQSSGPQGSGSSGPGDSHSGGGRPSRSRGPRGEGRSGGGDRPRSGGGGRDRSFGGDRRGGRDRSGGRGGDRPDGRRGRSRDGDKPSADAKPKMTAANVDAPSAEADADLLASVSRSFSLTIGLLPDPLRAPITLGYLLARSTDTVADTPNVVPGSRLEHLRALLEMVKYGPDAEVLRPLQRDLGGKQANDGERELLKKLPSLLSALEAQPTDDRWDLRRTLARIGRGQELDLLRFGEGTAEAPKPLQSAEELDEYTYFVAGCVGELWTRLCERHLPAGWSKRSFEEMLTLSKRFGQGLQMVNILRDLPEDLRDGRCYLPVDLLNAHGLEVADLRDNPQKARPLLNELRRKTLDHLNAAWEYVVAINPRKLRYACALPVLIGLQTLGLLAKTSPLETSERLKVSRGEVKKLMASALVGSAISPWMNRLHRKLRVQAAGK